MTGDEQQRAGDEQLGLREHVAAFLDGNQGGEQIVARPGAALRCEIAEVVGELQPRSGPLLGYLGRQHERLAGQLAQPGVVGWVAHQEGEHRRAVGVAQCQRVSRA
ncbi:MAG: hypothetical protein ACRDT0_01085 [Pseudonocardiaceae bacterium]